MDKTQSRKPHRKTFLNCMWDLFEALPPTPTAGRPLLSVDGKVLTKDPNVNNGQPTFIEIEYLYPNVDPVAIAFVEELRLRVNEKVLPPKFNIISEYKKFLQSKIGELKNIKLPSSSQRRRGRRRGSAKAFAVQVAALLASNSERENIYSNTWEESYIRPKPNPNSMLWKNHKERVDNTIYNLTKRRNKAKAPRKNSQRKRI